VAGLRIGTGDAVRKNWTAGCIARTRGKDGDAGESFSQDGLGMAAESLGVQSNRVQGVRLCEGGR
jgi:hypothetical protein